MHRTYGQYYGVEVSIDVINRTPISLFRTRSALSAAIALSLPLKLLIHNPSMDNRILFPTPVDFPEACCYSTKR